MKKRLLALLLGVVLCLSQVSMAYALRVDVDENGNGMIVDDDTTKDPETPDDPGTDDPTPERPSDNDRPSSSRDDDDDDDDDVITIRGGSAGSTAYGRVSCSPARPKTGDTVTVTAHPKDGYQADSITVKDSRGNEIEVRKTGENEFTFTMPSGRVTIAPAFSRVQTQRPEPSSRFTDVAAGSYCFDAVAWAVEKGITTGVTDTTFSPNAPCTRAQIVTFLWRAAGSPAAEGENPFTDVPAGSYFYDAVQWAVAQGITGGTTDTTFSPNAPCTRGQAVTFLYRSNGSPESGGTSAFTDVDSGAYYAGAVAWAVEKGVTAGTTASTFSPGNTCTRGQIVTFLYRDMA